MPKSVASELFMKYIRSLQETNTEMHPFFSEGLLKDEKESTDSTVVNDSFICLLLILTLVWFFGSLVRRMVQFL